MPPAASAPPPPPPEEGEGQGRLPPSRQYNDPLDRTAHTFMRNATARTTFSQYHTTHVTEPTTDDVVTWWHCRIRNTHQRGAAFPLHAWQPGQPGTAVPGSALKTSTSCSRLVVEHAEPLQTLKGQLSIATDIPQLWIHDSTQQPISTRHVLERLNMTPPPGALLHAPGQSAGTSDLHPLAWLQ
jgi:hypothetical protein